jgi:hypothetical protein
LPCLSASDARFRLRVQFLVNRLAAEDRFRFLRWR